MSVYLMPVTLLSVLIYGWIKKIKLYDCFVDGTKEALKLVLSIFPYIGAIFVCIQLFRESGLSHYMAIAMSYPFKFLGIPTELCELIMLIPFSGGGSVALLENVIATYGADSYIVRCACTIMGSSETIFYIATVYFSGCGIKKLRYGMPVALISSFVGTIGACLLCRFL